MQNNKNLKPLRWFAKFLIGTAAAASASVLLLSAKPAAAEEVQPTLSPTNTAQTTQPLATPGNVINLPANTFVIQTSEGTVTCPAKTGGFGFSLLVVGFNTNRVSDTPSAACQKLVEYLQLQTTIADIYRAVAGLPPDEKAAYQRAIAQHLMRTRFGMPESGITSVQVQISSFDTFWHQSDQEVIRQMRVQLTENALILRRLNRIRRQNPGAFDVPTPTEQDVDQRLQQAAQERDTNRLLAEEDWQEMLRKLRENAP